MGTVTATTSSPQPPPAATALVTAERVYVALLVAFLLCTGLSHFLQQIAAFALFLVSFALPAQRRSRVPGLVWAGLAVWAAAVCLAKLASPFGPSAWLDGGQTLWILVVLPAILRAPAWVLAPERMRIWLSLLLAGLSVSLLMGLWQMLTGDDPLRLRPLDGMFFDADVPRARGLQTNPLTFAGLMSLGAVALALYLRRGGVGSTKLAHGALWLGGIALCLVGVAVSGSRIYWLVVPVVLALLWAGRRPGRLAVVYSALCAAAMLAALALQPWLPAKAEPAPWMPAVAPLEQPSEVAKPQTDPQAGPHTVTLTPAYERLVLWRLAFEAWLTQPITGVGPNSVQRAMHEIAERDNLAVSPELGPHNLLLEILVQTGLVGLWAFGLAVLLIGRGLIKQRGLRRDAAVALVALMLLVGLVESALFDSEIQQLFFVLLGLHVAAHPAKAKPD